MHTEMREEDVVRALRGVIDPEMHVDIYTLGLIYQITISGREVLVLMTLTTPLCPYANEIVAAVKTACDRLGVQTDVQVTFNPPWVAPPDLRAILGV